MEKESLFSRLYKKKDIEEDYITEAFAGILINLSNKLKGGENCLTLFFNRLNKNIVALKFGSPLIYTQLSSSSGRHDLVIKDQDIVIIFENKWDAPTNLKQLQDYDNDLSNYPDSRKILIHLTKSFEEIDSQLFKCEFYKINWSDVYESLKQMEYDFMINEFLKYLEERGIAMDKVGWEIINGAKSVYSLTRLIKRACEEIKLRHEWKTTSTDYTSQLIDRKLYAFFLFRDAKLFFGISADKPPIPEMMNQFGNQYGVYFNFDQDAFFCKPLEGQLEILKKFISDLLEKLNSVHKSSDI